jgi:hypothetical protein
MDDEEGVGEDGKTSGGSILKLKRNPICVNAKKNSIEGNCGPAIGDLSRGDSGG